MIADKERLILKIFHDYYVRNMSQGEIATRHFISRQKVQRFLEQGRNANLVEVRVKFPERMHGTLESELEDRYGLLEAIIADNSGEANPAIMKRNVAELASDYILRILRNDMTVSIAWSGFVAEMMEIAARKIDQLREKPRNIDIVLTLGGLVGAEPDLESLVATRRLAGSIGGKVHLLLAPGMTGAADAWRAVMDDPKVAGVVDLARRADAAFYGVGALEGGSKLLDSVRQTAPEFLPRLAAMGVVGDINGRFIDQDGVPVVTELDKRLVGLAVADVKSIPLVIGITAGPAKFRALRAALLGKYFKVVVTDVDNARSLMANGKV